MLEGRLYVLSLILDANVNCRQYYGFSKTSKRKTIIQTLTVKTGKQTCPKVGWLFWVERLFETIFQSITSHLPKRGRMERKSGKQEKNNPKNPYTILTVRTAGPWPTISQIRRIPRL